jgi:hypothetical protein
MALIDSTYFRNDISLTIGTYSDIDQYIAKHEKEVLIGLLGYTLYSEMMAAYELLPGTPLPEKWDRLINGYTYDYNGVMIRWNGLINSDKVSFIAYYVYCQYIKAKQFPKAQAGTVQPKNENSVVVDGIANHTAAWNRFVVEYSLCQMFMFTNESDYVGYLNHNNGYAYTNNFGI